MPVDGAAAATTLLGFGTWRRGFCLEAVWAAYKRNGARTNITAETAAIGWERSPGKHHGDRNPPPGVPVWFGPKPGSAAGDVVISLGGGRVAATDWPRNGVIGVTTIDARQRQIGRPYLGWTETILGAPIDYGHPATQGHAPAPRPPAIPMEEDDMLMLEVKVGARTHRCSLGPGVFRHFIESDPADHIKNLARADDRWQPIDITQLPAALRTWGCDLHIWDVRDGEFVVLDPLDGSIRSGNMWSAANASRAGVERVKVTSAETADYLAKVAAFLEALEE